MRQNVKMKITLSKLASEIARTLSLKHHKKDAYRILSENGFNVLIGLCVEPNPYTSLEFSVHYYIQGLYIPHPRINLSLGDRIGRWERTDISTALPVIKDCYEHLPCDSIATIIDRLNNHQLHYWGSEINRYEFYAYSYLVTDRYDEARDYLNRIVAFENDKNADWFEDRVRRAKKLLDLMDNGKRGEIRDLLLSWQRYTMAELKLPEQ